MVQSPSWEANWFAASQEIPRISRNPKVHYRTHKGQPHVVGPCRHGMARPQVADRGTASDKEGSCE